jgi:hypothetical protein
MTRERLSTTVDGDRLRRARALFGDRPDSELVDRALTLLIRDLDAERERRVLRDAPYEHDPDLLWQAPDGPALPYDGDVPAEVLELARERRASYRTDGQGDA